MPIHYRLYVVETTKYALDKKSYPYSLGLYLGPYFSTGDANGVRRNDQLGGLAGVDLYISHNFSIGYEIHITDAPDQLFNMIFHF
ncbi:MAG: hypothetical protein HQ559_00570 [Lentisphaerae bacterium]|nr:hypothetical protein [Lentisphaerota bacterium]